jgi:hypothetical protein
MAAMRKALGTRAAVEARGEGPWGERERAGGIQPLAAWAGRGGRQLLRPRPGTALAGGGGGVGRGRGGRSLVPALSPARSWGWGERWRGGAQAHARRTPRRQVGAGVAWQTVRKRVNPKAGGAVSAVFGACAGASFWRWGPGGNWCDFGGISQRSTVEGHCHQRRGTWAGAAA